MEPNRREFIKQCAFQKFCNTVLHNEACDAHKELQQQTAHKFKNELLTLKRQCITLHQLNQPCYPESPLLHLRFMPIFHNLQLVYNDRD